MQSAVHSCLFTTCKMGTIIHRFTRAGIVRHTFIPLPVSLSHRNPPDACLPCYQLALCIVASLCVGSSNASGGVRPSLHNCSPALFGTTIQFVKAYHSLALLLCLQRFFANTSKFAPFGLCSRLGGVGVFGALRSCPMPRRCASTTAHPFAVYGFDFYGFCKREAVMFFPPVVSVLRLLPPVWLGGFLLKISPPPPAVCFRGLLHSLSPLLWPNLRRTNDSTAWAFFRFPPLCVVFLGNP